MNDIFFQRVILSHYSLFEAVIIESKCTVKLSKVIEIYIKNCTAFNTKHWLNLFTFLLLQFALLLLVCYYY